MSIFKIHLIHIFINKVQDIMEEMFSNQTISLDFDV